jgi:hypothetical protein
MSKISKAFIMIRKMKITVSPLQKLEYAKLMVEQGYLAAMDWIGDGY